ncbi:MAG: nucleoside deaminase [Microscillaceae bacterium]|nr:nucleoside deaminase [Microscillaceae bacterium]
MRHCLDLAEKALAIGNPPVGAIIVQNGKIVAEGREAGRSKQDITRHAELEAIRAARRTLSTPDFSDCLLYTTHEPCWMCAYAIRHHRLGQLFIGSSVPYIGGASSEFPILLTRHVPQWTEPPRVETGILQAECEALWQRFLQMGC